MLATGLVLLAALSAIGSSGRAQTTKKDYLTEIEADKIRDAETPSERVKLFLTFAADRLKKFQYELSRTEPNPRRGEMLNGLLNAYSGCIDDAADRIGEARESGADARPGIKEMRARAKEFLEELEKLSSGGADRELYQETLNDAIEATRDALREAEKASKEMPAGPVRRKP
jgi:chromosome segregation ATPase